MVIASGNSDRHVRFRSPSAWWEGRRPRPPGFAGRSGTEGERDGEVGARSTLQDVVVHVMLPRVREFYGLERLWDGGPALPAPSPAVSPVTGRRRHTSR